MVLPLPRIPLRFVPLALSSLLTLAYPLPYRLPSDISGRIRKGPAPLNLEIPEYSLREDDGIIQVG
jgi:hypothetical protein